MPPLNKTLAEYDTVSLSAELGGFLFTPSMLINCFVSRDDRYRMYGPAIRSILGHSSEFMLKGYILDIDKIIVEKNIEQSQNSGCLTTINFGEIQRIINSLETLESFLDIEVAAHDRSGELALYDARRMEAAFQHGLTLLSCEPTSFTRNSDELTHLFRYRYVDVKIGECELVDAIEHLSHIAGNAYVWVFEPQVLEDLLDWVRNGKSLARTNRVPVLELQNFMVMYNSSSEYSKGYTVRVWLLFNGKKLTGVAQEDGIIDAALRAVENALKGIVNLDRNNVHHRISDTTKHINKAQVSIQLDVPEQ